MSSGILFKSTGPFYKLTYQTETPSKRRSRSRRDRRSTRQGATLGKGKVARVKVCIIMDQATSSPDGDDKKIIRGGLNAG